MKIIYLIIKVICILPRRFLKQQIDFKSTETTKRITLNIYLQQKKQMDNNNNFDGDYTVADKEETTIISSVGSSALENDPDTTYS